MRTKNFVIFLLVFFVSMPVFGEIEIFGSIFGAMSDPGSWSEFSCIMPNGVLNKLKWQGYMKLWKSYGATSTRELPFLVDSDKKTITPNYMPFLFRDGKYDLDQFNPQYFENLETMARTANGEGIIFYFSLFGPHGNWPTSPWVLNHQGVNGYYDMSPKADSFRRMWIRKALMTLTPKYVVGFELANEPRSGNFPEISSNIMLILKKFKVPLWRVIMGSEFILSDRVPGNRLYVLTKRALRKLNLWNKREVFGKVIHGAELWIFQQYWHMQKHWSRCFISDDGCHPKKSAKFWENVLTGWFRAVKLRKNKFFKTRSAFEHLYRYPQDDITGVYGIAKAVENVYGIKMYTKTPEQLKDGCGTGDDVSDDAGSSDTAEGFEIKKKKWYEIALEILKAILEVLTGKK